MSPALRLLLATFLALLPAAATAAATNTDANTDTDSAAESGQVAARPLAVVFDGGFGAPTGFFGGTVGYTVPRTLWAAEAGFGLGSTGWQVAAQAKRFFPLGDGGWSYFTLQGGPSVGMLGKPVGTVVPAAEGVAVDDSAVYWVLWLHAGAGWEARASWGGVLRFAGGVMLNAANTQADLCPGTSGEKPGDSACTPLHTASGPEVARGPKVLPWFGLAYGWAF